jgi:prolyl 4-hydroxylase
MSSEKKTVTRVLILLLLLLPAHLELVTAAEVAIGIDGTSAPEECSDQHESCPYWTSIGECTANPAYMHTNCPKSCGTCDCVDVDQERCPQWAIRNNCVGTEEEFMYTNCIKSCKACGYHGDALVTLRDERRKLAAVGGDARLLETPYGYSQTVVSGMEEPIRTIVDETATYIETKVKVEAKYDNVRKTCLNRNDSCAYWKHQGACETNKAFMRQNCAPTCQICEELDFFFWCPLDPTKPMAVPEPGDLDKLFERIVQGKDFKQFSPHIISMPNNASHPNARQGPWIIELETFLSDSECDHLVNLGAIVGYKQSTDTGAKRADGTVESITSTWRTSATAWCSGTCLEDELIQQLERRVEFVTGISPANSEHLQFLKYQTGEFYKYHHDCTPYHVERQMGPRILTMFFYLNTPEDGGGTDFPDLNITIVPKKGKAVLWPNVLNDKPLEMDRRTAHQALPVDGGEKYGANLWIHQRDWREVAARGCI